MKLKRVYNHTYQLVEADTVLALVLRFSNDAWGLFDTDERRIERKTFPSAAEAKKWFVLHHMKDKPNER